MLEMNDDAELVQVAERALADAEEALRRDPTEANQRRVMSAWSFVRKSRERDQQPGPPSSEPAE
jgi:hypothetical protein